MSLVIREIIRQYVNDVLENGVIEESESPWSAPVVLEDGVSVWILELWMCLRKAVIHSLGQMIFENRSVEHGILVFLIKFVDTGSLEWNRIIEKMLFLRRMAISNLENWASV